MKKTTKILLVLAAVVAMTIGAVSTVMAADEYQTIGAWSYDSNAKTYSATDVNGEQIVRGWAQENGRWYFFDSAIMLTNAFVTWKDDVYFLDGNGCMAVGWIEFDEDLEVKAVDKVVEIYDNVVEAFDADEVDDAGRDLFTDIFVDKTTYKTMWCYFDEHGVMANHEWVEAWGLWYFIYGPYCVMDNYSVQIRLNDDDDLKDYGEGIYGFSGNGNMHVGWVSVDENRGGKENAPDAGTPFEGTGKSDKIDENWTYYHTDGKQVDAGWEKIGGKWCYFVNDAALGNENELGKLLLRDTIIVDDTTSDNGKYVNGATMYLDADGFMVTGSKTFAAESVTPVFVDEDHEYIDSMSIAKKDTATFYFNTETGAMQYGIIGNYYYNNTSADTDTVYVVIDEDVVTGGAIEIDASTLAELDGEKVLAKNFFLKTINSKKEVVYYYFEYGKMIKNEAIKFGDTVIAIDKDGLVRTDDAGEEITIDGIKYKFVDADTASLTLGDDIVINGLVRKK